MSYSTAPFGNKVTFGNHAENITAVGGDNHGTITHITTTHPDSRPQHEMHAEKRVPTPVTDRLVLVLNLVMTVCSIASVAVSVVPLVHQVSKDGVKSLAALPASTFWLLAIGVLLFTLCMVGSAFRRWLRDRTYSDHPILGYVPEGRLDAHGRYRLHFTKLRGTCAIDGSQMRPVRAATRETTLYMTDGTTKTRYSDYELQMRCRKLGHKDPRHRGKVDLSGTEE